MEAHLSYEQVQTEHPELIPTLVEKIRKGRGKLRHTDPSTWKWYYLWHEGWPNGVTPEYSWTKVKEIQGLMLVALCGHSGSWSYLTKTPAIVSLNFLRRNSNLIIAR